MEEEDEEAKRRWRIVSSSLLEEAKRLEEDEEAKCRWRRKRTERFFLSSREIQGSETVDEDHEYLDSSSRQGKEEEVSARRSVLRGCRMRQTNAGQAVWG